MKVDLFKLLLNQQFGSGARILNEEESVKYKVIWKNFHDEIIISQEYDSEFEVYKYLLIIRELFHWCIVDNGRYLNILPKGVKEDEISI